MNIDGNLSGIASVVTQELTTAKASVVAEKHPYEQPQTAGVVVSLSAEGVAMSVAAQVRDNANNQPSVAALQQSQLAQPAHIERSGALQQTEDVKDIGLMPSSLERQDKAHDRSESVAKQSELNRKYGELSSIETDEQLTEQQKNSEIGRLRSEIAALEDDIRQHGLHQLTQTRNNLDNHVNNSARSGALKRNVPQPQLFNQRDVVLATHNNARDAAQFEQVQQLKAAKPREFIIDMLV